MPRFHLPFSKPHAQPPQLDRLARGRVRNNDGKPLPRAGQNRTFSYYANRSQSAFNQGREALQNKPPLRRLPSRIQRLRRHFGWLLAVVIAVGALAYELQLSSVPRVVSTVQTADAPFLKPSSVYAEAAHALFDASATSRSKLTIDASYIADKLKQQFPELQEVVISLPLIGDQPTIFIKPAVPALTLSTGTGNYILDENGRAVATTAAAQSLARLHLPAVVDQSGLTVTIGQQVLPRSATMFISVILQQLKSQKIAVKSMTLPVAASELDVYIEGQPYFVKFNIHDASTETAMLQAGTFAAVSKQLARQGKNPAEYIDVRLEGRAYYK